MKVLEWSQQISHCKSPIIYKSTGIFLDAQGQVTHKSWLDPAEFRTHSRFMSVLIACKNEEDPIKNEGTRAVTTLFIDFSDAQPKSVMESCGNSN